MMSSRAQAKSQPPQPSQPLLLPASLRPPLTWLRLPPLRLSRRRLPLRLLQKPSQPQRRQTRQPSLLRRSSRPLPLQRIIARRAKRAPHRQPVRCPSAGWSCPKLGPARSIRRPSRIQPPRSKAREARPPAPAFSAASRSSTATPPAVPAVARSALPEALPDKVNSPQAVPAPSIPRAQRPAAMPGPVDLARLVAPTRVPVLARGLALDQPVRVASAARDPAPAALRQPARRPARSAPPPVDVAAARRSTPRPRKAR